MVLYEGTLPLPLLVPLVCAVQALVRAEKRQLQKHNNAARPRLPAPPTTTSTILEMSTHKDFGDFDDCTTGKSIPVLDSDTGKEVLMGECDSRSEKSRCGDVGKKTRGRKSYGVSVFPAVNSSVITRRRITATRWLLHLRGILMSEIFAQKLGEFILSGKW